ncbi:glycoside hydrolase family 99-like domain-containing protein [Kiritimatiellaeota bacterium B1221]|nr:glycoside hydrolase family 99-like domain-containing protein [Kiritimatiellaeota bacterium B1221]
MVRSDSMNDLRFHPRAHQDQPLALPAMLGHFLPWYTLKGDAYPLSAEDAALIPVYPEIEDMRHWNDARSGYHRTHLQMPECGCYDSRDPEVIEWQIRTAVLHGISGFIVNWYGANSVENVLTLHWLRGLEKWNHEHPESPFCYCLSFDTQAQWPSEGKVPQTLEEDFVYIRDHLIRDAYLCRDGRPLFPVFPYGDQCRELREVFDRVFGEQGADLIWSGAPAGKGEDACYAWVRPDSETMNAPDEAYFWSDPDNAGLQFLQEVLQAANEDTSNCAYAMHGVWPEFNNSLVAWAWQEDPNKPTIRPSIICRETRGGNTLEQCWKVLENYQRDYRAGKASAAVPVPLIQLVTWNDYAETSVLEPTREHGNRDLLRCAEALQRLRSL